MKAQRRGTGIFYLSITSTVEEMGCQSHVPAVSSSGKRPGTYLEEAAWAPGPIWTGAKKKLTLPGYDPWTIQPVVCRSTD